MTAKKKLVALRTRGPAEETDLLYIDKGGYGVEIYGHEQGRAQADDRAYVEIDHGHCHACPGDLLVREVLKLSELELDQLRDWIREYANDIVALEIKGVLEKIMQATDNDHRIECQTETGELEIRVELVDG
jgi:hypothetical protein